MIFRAGHSIVRALQMTPILLLMFSGCTCSEEAPPVTSAPKAAAPQQSPASAALPTATVAVSTPPAAVPPTEAPPPPAPDAAKKSECETYISTLSGRTKNPALLEKPEVRALTSYPNLIMCGAVASDSDEMCKKLMGTESGPNKTCRRMWSTFRELRTYPKGRSFMFEEVDWEECRDAPFPGAKICDAFREAMRSADVKKCAATGNLQSVCRAYIGLDASLCRVEGTLEQTTIPERKKGEGPIDIKSAVAENCRITIGERAPLAAGLEALTSSGQPQLKEFAKAALGQKDACAPFAAEAMQGCATSVPTAPPAPQASPPTAAPIKDLRTPENDTSKTPPAEPPQVS